MVTYKQLKFVNFSSKCNQKNTTILTKIFFNYKDLRKNLYGGINKKIYLIGFYQLTQKIKLFVILK
jgi:hypothetical protein